MIDYRKFSPSPWITTIKGLDIEIVDTHKYLGVVIDNKLTFQPNSLAVGKKVQQRLFFLRKLKSFSVCPSKMSLFYKQFIESVLSFCIVAWYGNLSLSNKNRLGGLVKVAGKIIGVNQTGPIEIFQNSVVKKAQVILCTTDHPLHTEFHMLPSGRRFRVPVCRTKRTKD